MKPRDKARIDTLTLDFKADGNPLAGSDEGLNGFLDALEAHAGELMPTSIQELRKRKRKYSRESFRKALAEAKVDFPTVSLYFERPPSPEVTLSLHIFGGKLPDSWSVLLYALPFSFFQEPAHEEERSRKLVDLVSAWASRYPPTYVQVHSTADNQLADDPNDKIGPIYQVNEVYWLNVFGRKLVESMGRERVLSTPGHRVEELPGGSVLLITRPTISDVTSDKARMAQARALVHLRPELRFDEVLARLRERSAALVPVEPRFDPDIASLLEQVVDQCGIHKRQRRIAELNAWRPAEVSEWLPREAAPPSDVPDPVAVSDEYGALYAEQLIAMMHTKVPELLKAGPESLTPLDYQFWYHDYTRHSTREELDELVPGLGAYLGEVMVNHLGGRWVPRKKLLESQVVVGERAWLPFLRARHFLETGQSPLDFSFTKFYRVAERHLRNSG